MISLGLVCVSYNSDESALKYISTVKNAAEQLPPGVELAPVLVDNSERNSSEELFAQLVDIYPRLICIKASTNMGYFGGIRKGIESLKDIIGELKYLIVSNVDIELELGFLAKLVNLPDDHNRGVLAPSVLSKYRKTDVNPKMVKRPSSFRMWLNERIFSLPPLFVVYEMLSVSKDRLKGYVFGSNNTAYDRAAEPYDIYAPHGAIMIFTGHYLKFEHAFSYPIFLFGEEVFVAETAIKHNLSVTYCPSLRVYDDDHVSTGKIGRMKISKLHANALKYINDTYY